MYKKILEYVDLVHKQIKLSNHCHNSFVYKTMAFNVGIQSILDFDDEYCLLEQKQINLYNVMCVDLLNMKINPDNSFSLCYINNFMGEDIYFPYSFKSTETFKTSYDLYKYYEKKLKEGVNIFKKEDDFGVVFVKNGDDCIVVDMQKDKHSENNQYNIPHVQVILKSKDVFVVLYPLMIDSIFKTLRKNDLGKIAYDYIKTSYTRFNDMSEMQKKYAVDLLGTDNYTKFIEPIYKDDTLTIRIKTPTGRDDLYDIEKSIGYLQAVEYIGEGSLNNYIVDRYLCQKIKGSVVSSLCEELFKYLTNPTQDNLKNVLDNTLYAFLDCGDLGVVFFNQRKNIVYPLIRTKFGLIECNNKTHMFSENDFTKKEQKLEEYFNTKCAMWMKLTGKSKEDFYFNHRTM